VFYYFFILIYLRSGDLVRLDVVTVEVALEVEVGELLIFRNLKELAESSIRLDVMLVLEVLLLHVVVDLLGDIGAADEGAVGVTKELVELIRDLRRDFEDGRATLGGFFTFGADTALALAGILEVTVDTLVKLLDFSDGRRDSIAHGNEAGEDILEVIIESGGRGSHDFRGGGSDDRGSNDDGVNRGSDFGLDSRLAASLLHFSGSDRGGRSRGRGSNGSRSRGRDIFSLLGDTLGLGNNSRAHYTSTGGSIHLF